MKLSGKTALITGGAQGLGKGFAEAILEQGGKVVLADINFDTGYATAMEFNETYGPGRALFIKCDVTKDDEIEHAFEISKQTYGYIDIVVNNAGIADEINWKKTIDINLIAVIVGSKLGVKYLSKQSGGRGGIIVNISSTAGLTAVPFESVYSASKHGVVGLTRSMAQMDEVIDGGIRMCSLNPSFTATPLVVKNLELADDSRHISVDSVGIMKVEDVVKGFMKILEWDDLNGGVVSVTPKGIKVIFPRKYKAKL